MIRVRDIIGWLDSYAPFRYAASWDHCGLQVGDPEARVERIMVALDATSGVLKEAETHRCRCLITHHPLIFRPLDSVRFDGYPGGIVARAILKRINVIAAHTNLDAARGGTNEQLAGLLSLDRVEPLEIESAWAGEVRYAGMGCVGTLPRPLRLASFAESVARLLGSSPVRAIGDPKKQIVRTALCTGSGAGLIGRAICAGADVYVTGDIKYHEARQAEEQDLCIVDVGHFASEKLIVAPLAEWLRTKAVSERAAVEILAAQSEKDPFRTVGA